MQKLWYQFLFNIFYKWDGHYLFSAQDGSVMPNQKWNVKEMLSPTDFGIVQWRKLVVTKHFGGRNSKFGQDEVPTQTAKEIEAMADAIVAAQKK